MSQQESSTEKQLPEVAQQVDSRIIKQFMTEIKSAEQQVGEHVIQALQADDTVAVLTTVVVGGDGGQRIVSAALDPEQMQQVRELLAGAQEQRDEHIPCVGFHCFVKPRQTNTPKSEEKKS